MPEIIERQDPPRKFAALYRWIVEKLTLVKDSQLFQYSLIYAIDFLLGIAIGLTCFAIGSYIYQRSA